MSGKSKGGKRPGAGRPAGARNKRTVERIEAFKAAERGDPLDMHLELAEGYLAKYRVACVELAKFEGQVSSFERLSETKQKEHRRLAGEVDRLADHVHRFAMAATPFVHAKLTASEVTANVTTHEQALAALDD